MEVSPPKTLKNPVNIQKWWDDPEKQAAAKKALVANAEWTKLLGAIDRVVAFVPASQDFFDSDTRDEEECSAGTAFVRWLLSNYGEFPDCHGSADMPITLYAFEPKPLLRLAGQNAIRDGVEVPLGLWYSGVDGHCLDPLQMLLETSVKGKYSLKKVCLEAPGGPIPLPSLAIAGSDSAIFDYVTHQNPENDLKVVTELCVRYNLLPRAEDRSLREQLASQPELGLCDPPVEEESKSTTAAKPKAKTKKK
jgi:hypothetical protein